MRAILNHGRLNGGGGKCARQARIDAEARGARPGGRLRAEDRERALAKRQLEHADRVYPDRA